jgi:hypothetical protein
MRWYDDVLYWCRVKDKIVTKETIDKDIEAARAAGDSDLLKTLEKKV